ncbi:MAG: hypothetical protein AAFV43_14200 [Planctomycetota bacterium]
MACLIGFAGHSVSDAAGVSPASPEVRQLVRSSVEALKEIGQDQRLGGRCLAAIALLKAGEYNHPRVGNAVAECVSIVNQPDEFTELDNYSFGLAMILLCEDQSENHASTISKYLDELGRRQKEHGGWGYSYAKSGDTSQTQYLALALWAAHARGVSVKAERVKGLVSWLLATQDPEGGWGYQGKLGSFENRVKQSRVSCTLTAAALSSLMIAADMCGRLRDAKPDAEEGDASAAGGAPVELDNLPPGVSLADAGWGDSVQSVRRRGKRRISGAGIAWDDVEASVRFGEAWMEKNFVLPVKQYPIYYLYALERYHSFREYRDSIDNPAPEWYGLGYEYLKETRRPGESWEAGCKPQADTSLAILFLLRSTQQSLRKGIGEGLLTSGRGLPRRLAEASLEEGRVVAKLGDTDAEGLLDLIQGDDADELEALARNPRAVDLKSVSDADVRRLKQLLRGENPDARYLAATALGRLSRLDDAPDLIYALTDPERRVAVAARDGLRAISRRSRGFGMGDDFDDDARFAAIEQWKSWYRRIRPSAVLE